MKTKKHGIILFFCLISQLALSDTTQKNQPAPELSVPRFDFDEKAKDSKRDPANQEEAQDLLSELESLLENPAQRDAKSQLGVPQDFINPLPQMKADIPIENPKKVEVIKPPVLTTPIVKSSAKKTVTKRLGNTNNELTAVDFVSDGAVQKIILQTRDSVKFKFIPNKKTNTLMYVLERTGAPKKLKQKYEMKEFQSSIKTYQITQTLKKKIPTTILSVKMRDFTIPKAIQASNKLTLEFQDKSKVKPERLLASELPATSFGGDAFEAGQGYRGEPIEKLELKNTDVAEAIKLVLRSSGYNLVLGEDVKGNIGSLSLQNIPWDQALHIILQMKKLGFVRTGNLIRIATLDSLKVEQEQLERQEELEPIKTVLIPVSYAKATNLAPRAQSFLSKRGKLDTDDRTNTIIVRDTDSVISRLQKLFNVLDTQPPAVSISAKFIEVKKDFTRSLGLGVLNLAGQTSGISFGSAQEPIAGPGFQAQPGSGTINLSAPKFAALQAKLLLGESESKVKVLANPTITVQQGQQGSIVQGKTTDVPQQASGLATVSTSLTQTANLSLNVTPIVANDGSIALETNLLQEIPFNVGTTLTKDTRSIRTQIILQNGDTAVLGGIFSGEEKTSNRGVPFLKNLPLLGLLFSEQTNSVNQNEVLIFITARILNPDSAFKQKI